VHKLVVIYLNPSIAVSVKASKGFAELLDDNASPNEPVEGDSRYDCASSTSLIGFDVYPKG